MYADKAEAFFMQNYNCAQAVLGAFADAFGMDFDDAMKAASSLGGGLGQSGEVCGAVLGMCMAIGIAKGYTDPTPAAKDAHTKRIKRAMDAFRETYSKTGCDDLKVPGDRSVCARIVRFAAEAAAKEISES